MSLYKYKIMPQPALSSNVIRKRKRKHSNQEESDEQGGVEDEDGWIRKKTNISGDAPPEFTDLVHRLTNKYSMNSLDFWLELGFRSLCKIEFPTKVHACIKYMGKMLYMIYSEEHRRILKIGESGKGYHRFPQSISDDVQKRKKWKLEFGKTMLTVYYLKLPPVTYVHAQFRVKVDVDARKMENQLINKYRSLTHHLPPLNKSTH